MSERQRNAIELLLQGLSDAKVAEQIGVDRVTVFRWRQKQAFRRDLAHQRRLVWKQSIRRIQSMVQPALDVLHSEVTGTDRKAALRAASILLRFATPGRLERMNASSAKG